MRCITLLLILGFVSVEVRASLDVIWDHWKRQHGKAYDGIEEVERRAKWERNVATINLHNLKHDLGQVTYQMGLNQYSDMDWDEFKKTHLSQSITREKLTSGLPNVFQLTAPNHAKIPKAVDWRKVGKVVTEVKDQGNCGSCWAFSTTGAMEGQYNQHFSPPLEFSEQQLVDCSGDFDNHGCEGGLMTNSYKYIHKYGIEQEKDYKYRGVDDDCRYKKAKVVATCVNASLIPEGDEKTLQFAVATYGPVAVAIDAEPAFQHYKHGIFVDSTCSAEYLDHGVLAVGYGVEKGQEFWIVKNSWSSGWGEEGFIRMARNRGNMCGIATLASFPGVEKYP